MIRRLHSWWRRLFGDYPFTPLTAAPIAPDWTDDHVQALRRFLSQPIGQDLMARARATEYRLALSACQKNEGSISPDRAAGFSDCVSWIISLATLPVESPVADSNNSESPHGSRGEPVNDPAFAH